MIALTCQSLGRKHTKVSYPIYVYKMYPIDTVKITNDSNGLEYEQAMAYFEMPINALVDGSWTISQSEVNRSPLLMKEYNLGGAMSENVDGSIYVSRGINAALDKHLKLR